MEEKSKAQEAAANGSVGKAPKKKRLWTKIIGIVLLVIVLIFAGVLFFIDSILETGIRTGGSMILKTKVEVDSVRLKILRGTLDIKNLRVGNPEGSTNPYAFELPGFHFNLDIGSLMSDKIIVNKIEITGLKVDYEPRLKGGSNLQLLLDNMQDPNKKPPAEATEGKDAESVEKETSKKVVIRELIVQDGEISVTLLGQSAYLPLPPLTMTGIGEESDVTMAEAVTEFMKKLVGSVIDSSVSVVNSLGSNLKAAGETIGNAAGSNLKAAGKELESAAGGAIDRDRKSVV